MTAHSIVDKRGVLADPSALPLHLELGCGGTKRAPDAIGVDVQDSAAVDIVGDVSEVLQRLTEGSVRQITSAHFLEHVTDLPALLREFDRVLVPGGIVHALVPHFSNPYYYSDPTHVRFFGLYSFSYFCDDPVLRRQVPKYESLRLPWSVESVRIRLNSDPAFPARRFVRKVIGRIIRRSTRIMEFYEDTLVWMFPCYEIEFVLRKHG